MSSPLPPRARWRGITPPCACCGSQNLSFLVEWDAGVQTVLRLRLSAEAVRDLRDVLAPGYLAPLRPCGPCRDQSDRSAGSASVAPAPQDGSSLCPPTRSSSAASGE